MEFLIDKVSRTESNQEFLESMNQSAEVHASQHTTSPAAPAAPRGDVLACDFAPANTIGCRRFVLPSECVQRGPAAPSGGAPSDDARGPLSETPHVTTRGERPPLNEPRVQELEAALLRAERTVQSLRDVGLALGSTLDLDHLLELILNKTKDVLEADRATLYLLDEHRGRLLSRIMVGEEARSIELPLGEGIAGYVARTGRTVRVKDAYGDKRFLRLVGRPHRLSHAIHSGRAHEEPRREDHRRHPSSQ